jgi:hypothetical protein
MQKFIPPRDQDVSHQISYLLALCRLTVDRFGRIHRAHAGLQNCVRGASKPFSRISPRLPRQPCRTTSDTAVGVWRRGMSDMRVFSQTSDISTFSWR